ncbi:metal ABC transporter solute-binding protein, Zn/Mn family [Tepidibacter hydrothermalis]|uniref:Zinc ABC transporter substrate-binding protein n=1 Tax=Tepidibacter hydrothermalis TaxID=3036126 RepID=A0ABY8EFA0_9FIRM|nr:zinc ABC transporter substrate-binding protein [Tepidibacter hydrothermalis]WFD11630.1 zinc ABC transporter substrate-binding protein [Tepidibacter hydrothermalis]
MKSKVLIFFAVILSIFIISVNKSKTIQTSNEVLRQEDKIKVYTTIYPMYEFSKNIGKDKIDLRIMVPNSTKINQFKPNEEIIEDLNESDVLIYNGSEPWIDNIINSISNDKLIIVKACDGIKTIENEKRNFNMCLNPLNAVGQSNNIKNAFIKADNKNKKFYEKNYNLFKRELIKLDNLYSKEINKLSKKNILVSSNAFSYIANRYNLNQIDISDMSKQGDLDKFINDNEIKYIFSENKIDKNLEKISKKLNINILHLDSIDSLNNEIKSDYIEIMRDNLKKLKIGLKY